MTVDIAQADVLEWAKTYNGPQFHALLCDPPYHLSDSRDPRRASPDPAQRPRREKAAGFMGKDWDGGDIAFRPDTWAALAVEFGIGEVDVRQLAMRRTQRR